MSVAQIMVVEDEPIIALDLRSRLERLGYRAAVAASGEEAICRAAELQPDLVLMDISLSGQMDGTEAAECIWNEHHIPVVYLTAYSNRRTLERAKSAEPFGYLLKPFEEREVQTTIEMALYKHRAEQALRRAHDELERRVVERTAELRAANESLRNEILERERRQARQQALQRLREEVWRMQSAADLHKVLVSVRESLEVLEVPCEHCALNLVDASGERPTVRFYDMEKPEVWRDATGTRGAEVVMLIWLGGEAVYRRDLEAEDPYQERASLAQSCGAVRALLDVPFSHGTLAVNSAVPHAFSAADLSTLQELARALSEGFHRLEDLQRLAAERERLAVTLHSIGEGVIATDAGGRIVLLNRVGERLSGWSQDGAKGRPLTEVFHLVHEQTGARCENPALEVLAGGGAVELGPHLMLVDGEGKKRPIASSCAPICDDENKTIGAVLAFRDITAQRQVEEELLKSEKLDSLGVLAGGIAHDFNNILTTITGYLSLAKRDIDPDAKLFSTLSAVEKASQRATHLTQQLLTFSRGGAPIKKAASVAELIEDSATFILRGSNVRCEFDIAADLWSAQVDEGQISQVIQNLVLNADQAMPAGGLIRIAARNRSLRANEALPAGRYLEIAVEDHGAGIARAHLQRIFDPYFTTREKGSGLGLATAYSIIKNHGGHIAVESAPGKGATFRIYLPASSPAPAAAPAAAEAPGRGGRILVMDDEEDIRLLLGSLLKRLGYEADFARHGDEALEKYRRTLRAGEPFAAVIMDLTIPGAMGGKEAVEKLLELDPEARVVVSSGYSNDPVMADFARYGFKGIAAKPYTLRELGRVLGEVLKGPARA